MKATLWIGFCVLAALALSTDAHAWETPVYKVDGGVNVYLHVQTHNSLLQLAPWYLYWPAEASQLPIGPPIAYYPNWQPRPPATAFAYPPQPFPAPGAPPPGFQRASYQYPSTASQQTPAYWYGQ